MTAIGSGHDDAACELNGVTVTYGSTSAVRDLSLRVRRGETVALVGSSGAGKTTVLRLIAGIVAPSAGSARLLGSPIAEQRRQLPKLVGMMQQRLDLVSQLTVKHNVQAGALGRWRLARSLAALLLPVEHPPARAAAQRTGIAEKMALRVAHLSGGEAQRVALARLLVQDPAVMLADEPVASLDPARAHDVIGLLCDLANENDRTLLASLHAPELARAYFDRVVGLREGRIAFDLPTSEVTDDMLESLYRLLGPVDEPGGGPRDGRDDEAPAGGRDGGTPPARDGATLGAGPATGAAERDAS